MLGHLVKNKGLVQTGGDYSRMACEKPRVVHRDHSSGFLLEYFQALSHHPAMHFVPEIAAGEVVVLGVVQRGNQTWSRACCPIR